MRILNTLRFLFLVSVTACFLFSCSSDSENESSILGTWRTTNITAENCGSNNVSADIPVGGNLTCMDEPQGRVCRTLDFTFESSGAFIMDGINIYVLLDSLEEVQFSLDGMYELTSDSQLKLTLPSPNPEPDCINFSYQLEKDDLILTSLDNFDCMVVYGLRRKTD